METVSSPFLLEKDVEFRRVILNLMYRIYMNGREDLSGTEFDYDELLAEPISTIYGFSQDIGIEAREEAIDQIWSDLSFRQLEGAPPEHYQGGGSHKWIGKISPDQAATLNELGLSDWMEPEIPNRQKFETASARFQNIAVEYDFLDTLDATIKPIGRHMVKILARDKGLDSSDSDKSQCDLSEEELAYAYVNIGECYFKAERQFRVAARSHDLLVSLSKAVSSRIRFEFPETVNRIET